METLSRAVVKVLLEKAVEFSPAVMEPDMMPAVLLRVDNGGCERPEVCQSHVV